MGSISKPLKVAPAISGTITSGESATVTFPVGVQYFKITNDATGGALHWGWTAAHVAANPHIVATDTSTDNIIAHPLTLSLKAVGGNVGYSIFCVVEGK